MTKAELKEIKDMLQQTNEKIAAIDARITSNHDEIISRINNIEETAKKALTTAEKNEGDIFTLKNTQDELKESWKTELSSATNALIEDLNNTKLRLETQLRGALVELDDIRNRSMRSTLVFKNIKEKNKETWEQTTDILREYIIEELNLSYDYQDLDFLISRAHRGPAPEDNGESNNSNDSNRGPRPIYAQFVNWRIAEEI